MIPVNLDRIQEAIDAGKIDPNVPITMKTLNDARVVNGVKDGVKLLARVIVRAGALLIRQGKEMLSQPITIFVSRASREAIQSIENKGGKVTTVYYNKLGLQYLLHPEKFGTTKRVPRAALPVRRYLIGMSSPNIL
jgi:large subunit ribosomal protein L15